MDNLAARGLTLNLTSVALIEGASASTITSTVTSHGIIKGAFVTAVTALTNSATVTTDTATGAAFVAVAANKGTVLVFGQNAAGTVGMCQGSIEDLQGGTTSVAGTFIRAPQWPSLPDDFLPWAYCLVRLDTDALPYTPGTTAFGASGVTTDTFVNVCQLPVRPVAA